jgi:peptide/nickel transport system substrate-binding protein
VQHDPTWTRPPRPRRPRELLRTSIEIGAVATLAIVVLVFVGFVLDRGHGQIAPPPNTLVVSQTDDFASLDPALAQTSEAWELEYATCGKLVNYLARPGYAGTRIAPDLAVALPRISPDRLTYTFTVRAGHRLSDGEPITAEPYLREVAGWRARGRVLTIRLKTVAPDFTERLALPYFCAVPVSAPNHQVDTLPSAGPFMIADYRRGRSLVLKRNPYYRGPRRPHVTAIDYQFGAFGSQILLELEQGSADYGEISPAVFQALAEKFRVDPKHLFVVQQPVVAYLALNTQRPLFRNNPQLRRAVNYALDRPDLARLFGQGGVTPADEYLPPGFPGYEAKHVYPVGAPDFATARRLARGHLRGGHAVFLSCGSQDCKARAVVVAESLKKIGLHVRIDSAPGLGQFTLAGVKGTRFDIADLITRPDYGDPYALVDKLLDSRVIRDVGNTNISYFESPRFDRAIDAAQQLTGIASDRATGASASR